MELSPNLAGMLSEVDYTRSVRERKVVEALFAYANVPLRIDERIFFFPESEEWCGITPKDVIDYLRRKPQALKLTHEVYYFLEALSIDNLVIAMDLWEEVSSEIRWENDGF